MALKYKVGENLKHTDREDRGITHHSVQLLKRKNSSPWFPYRQRISNEFPRFKNGILLDLTDPKMDKMRVMLIEKCNEIIPEKYRIESLQRIGLHYDEETAGTHVILIGNEDPEGKKTVVTISPFETYETVVTQTQWNCPIHTMSTPIETNEETLKGQLPLLRTDFLVNAIVETSRFAYDQPIVDAF